MTGNARMMGEGLDLRTWLVLGRVSNLPTVWSNGIAGWVLAGQPFAFFPFLGVLVALSLFYVGGMYLNDAFDAEIDAIERPGRPIPSGAARWEVVFVLGFAMLGLGAVLGFAVGTAAGVAGLALAGAVVLYDWLHKRTPLSPLIMGTCRFLSYAFAAAAAGGWSVALIVGAGGLFAHVVGLTYAAKQEAYDRLDSAWPLAVLAVPVVIAIAMLGGWFAAALLGAYVLWGALALRFLFRRQPGDVPRAVVGLIAGISLYDATVVASAGAPVLAILAVGAFAATLALQKLAPGT